MSNADGGVGDQKLPLVQTFFRRAAAQPGPGRASSQRLQGTGPWSEGT